ncbi:hypothetical protein O7622_16560 [Micromonospora sp. WMMD1076]|uniref:hypothetical protein n=1 Tax=Micromonospora sp. WMMD1076 TaxID=3016103 RepID=UPI00249A26D5|nr:hypothetical protein [Micromonospora sp. WMMD1076]WFF10031.1 hypothetical protein O7622_16560 [Micromonospora sp. WMMD1076]
MLVAEFLTAVRHDLPVKVVINNNNGPRAGAGRLGGGGAGSQARRDSHQRRQHRQHAFHEPVRSTVDTTTVDHGRPVTPASPTVLPIMNGRPSQVGAGRHESRHLGGRRLYRPIHGHVRRRAGRMTPVRRG